MSGRFFKYLVSERGRSLSFNMVVASGITLFSVNYLPNTVGISRYREFLQLYK